MCEWQFHLPFVSRPNKTRHETHTLCMRLQDAVCAISIPACELVSTQGGGAQNGSLEPWALTLGCSPHFCALLSPELGNWKGRASGLEALLALTFNELGDFVSHLDGASDAVS